MLTFPGIPILALIRLFWNIVYNCISLFVSCRGILLYTGLKNDKYGNISSIANYLNEKNISFKTLNAVELKSNRLRSIIKIAQSKVIVIDSASPAGLIKLRDTTYLINCWHACGAYKKIAFDAKRVHFDPEKEERRIRRLHRCISYFICSSDKVASIFAKAFKEEKSKFLPLGVPRTDTLYRTAAAKPTIPTILYAPTFRTRDNNRTLPDPPDSSVLLPALRDALSIDVRLAYRGHPTCFHEQINGWEDWSNLPQFEALQKASLLITDYSSIFFDYLFYKRPIIFYVPDYKYYTENERQLYFSPFEMFPDSVCTDIISLQNTIIHLFNKNIDYSNFWNLYMASCDGNSTERVCDLIMNLIRK